jgi:hypothetical protein
MSFAVSKIAPVQSRLTINWHQPDSPDVSCDDAVTELVMEQHRANFDLWHTEDRARIPDVSGDEMIVIKHEIDRLNQTRNDLVEQIDVALMSEAPQQNEAAPLHSETPGLMIDRLSILALKIFHTYEEAHRDGASEEHHERNQKRLALLIEQREDLSQALVDLWEQVLGGRRRFKLYRQMKMYNDPSLNPAVYNTPST